ncbi:MAG: ATP-binding protein [Candidatus ainarchaeum sp.]|nr:ATP-binding protein [Candidatus ainarchaeum sp.]MDD3975899.1 ATP-binding protein [Candidatus ainarchaeum sp.]
MQEIKEWTQDEAELEFDKIINNNCSGEWYDIDWKLKLNFDSTGFKTNNTTQKAISGFANTYGGKLIIGINDDRELIGFKEIENIENHIFNKLSKKLLPSILLFKAKYYDYNSKKLLVIFVGKSKIPIQCDNGVYYYREQSAFLFMPHKMLESKFKSNFIEEMYKVLVSKELDSLSIYLKELSKVSSTLNYKISSYTKYIKESAEKLFFFYKENNMLDSFFDVYNKILYWSACEGNKLININEINCFIKSINSLYNQISSSKNKD